LVVREGFERAAFAGTVLAVIIAVAAHAAEQTILASQLVVRNPSTPDRRKVVARARERASPNTLVGDPVSSGASLTIALRGATPSAQTYALPAGTSVPTGKPFWSGDAADGFRYRDAKGENGPVRAALIRKTVRGVFQAKAVIDGRLGAVSVLPPDPGTDGCVLFALGGGDSYVVQFGPDGVVANTGATLFRISRATAEGPCACGSFLAKWGSGGSGDGQFAYPAGIAVDAAGNVYVADALGNRIQKFSAGGSFVTAWGGPGSGDGQFQTPAGVAVNTAGTLYVTDRDNHRIQVFTDTGGFVAKWGTQGTADGQLDRPYGLALDAAGNVYVAEAANHRIQVFTGSGGFVTKWGSLGSGDGQFDGPVGVALDAAANVYVSEFSNHRIQRFTSTGGFLGKWGSLGSGDGQFNQPRNVAVDTAGTVYVTDYSNHRVQVFGAGGGFVAKWGSPGGGDGQLAFPNSVAVDAAARVYVTDTGNTRVQKFAGCP